MIKPNIGFFKEEKIRLGLYFTYDRKAGELGANVLALHILLFIFWIMIAIRFDKKEE